MSYGIEIFDAEGELTTNGVLTFRLVGIVNVTTSTSFTEAVSLSGVEYDNDVVMFFSPSSSTQTFGNYNETIPTLTVSGSTATVHGHGIQGTVFVGVT